MMALGRGKLDIGVSQKKGRDACCHERAAVHCKHLILNPQHYLQQQRDPAGGSHLLVAGSLLNTPNSPK